MAGKHSSTSAHLTPANLSDISGARFGRLLVLGRDHGARHGKGIPARWHCRCDCGSTKSVSGADLRRGDIRSCGCLARELTLKRGFHEQGVRRRQWYRCWLGLRSRCNDPGSKDFPNYGGRGIRVCARWDDPFAFYADMGDPPSGASIDRIDNDGPYSPENCRWASVKQQARNRRTSTYLTLGGRTMTVAEWAAEIGVTPTALHKRASKGWGDAQVLLTPFKKIRRRTASRPPEVAQATSG